MKFKELQLSDKLLDAVMEMGYETVTPIQELAIPKILAKQDIIGLAQTGTGKTAAFALPLIDRLIKEYKNDRRIKMLVLTPTRELAIQNRDNIIKYAKNTNFKCSVILGGVNQHSQVEVLKKGIDILVATPGRLVDLMNQRKADLGNVEMLVLDEADTMLDMGFIKDIKTIISKTKETRQTLLFSATMPDEIKELTKTIMKNPTTIKTATKEITADNITEEVYFVDKANKPHLLLDLISTKEQLSTLIFTRTKHGANDLEDKLADFDIKCSVIHGNKTQSNRVKALQDFKTGHTKIMIATDIAARGIDINDLGLVINYDMPEQAEVYVHRIGRTARAGKNGKAISLCSSAEMQELRAIERLIKRTLPVIENTKYPMVLTETKPVRGRQSSKRTSQSRKTETRPSNNNRKEQPRRESHSFDDDKPKKEVKSFRSDRTEKTSSFRKEQSKRDNRSFRNSKQERTSSFSKERPIRENRTLRSSDQEKTASFKKDNRSFKKYNQERPTRENNSFRSEKQESANSFGKDKKSFSRNSKQSSFLKRSNSKMSNHRNNSNNRNSFRGNRVKAR